LLLPWSNMALMLFLLLLLFVREDEALLMLSNWIILSPIRELASKIRVHVWLCNPLSPMKLFFLAIRIENPHSLFYVIVTKII
jgi:hypothetical protein